VRSMHRSIHQTSAGFEDHEGFFSRILTKLYSLWVVATYPFAGKGRNLSLHYASEISRSLAPYFRLGNRVAIGKHTWFLSWSKLDIEGDREVKIVIEDDCRIGPRCTISAGNFIHFERDVVLESDVLVMDHSHAYEDVNTPISLQGTTPGGIIRIGEGCRIGRRAAILCSNKGEVVLGANCIVASGAVVTRSFPANSLLAGNPARAAQKSSPEGLRSISSGVSQLTPQISR
jgi:acetyltransferase-like isoleucine patch superfamily enzyme